MTCPPNLTQSFRNYLLLSLCIFLCFPVVSEAGIKKKLALGAAVVKGVKVLKAKKAAKQDAVAKKPANAKPVKAVTVSKSRYPESAKHIDDAQAAGQSPVVTIDRAGSAARRKAALKGKPAVRGLDRDEYPPAMMKEGGANSSVRNISPKDNRGSGSCVGHQCRGLPDGSTVKIKTIP